MLMLARQVRRMSQAQLVQALGGCLAQGTLSKVEHGRFQPDAETVDALAKALRVRASFFFDPSYLREPMVSFSRRRQKLSATELQAIFGFAEVYRLNLRKCFEAIVLEERLPSVPVIDPEAFDGRIKDISAAVRQRWKLPGGPVQNLTKTAEDAGIVIVPFEPGDLSHLKEEPTTLRCIIEAHLKEVGYTEAEIGDLFGLEERDLRFMYPGAPQRPKLRLIINERYLTLDRDVTSSYSRNRSFGYARAAVGQRRPHVSRTAHNLRSPASAQRNHGGGEQRGHSGWTGSVSEKNRSSHVTAVSLRPDTWPREPRRLASRFS